MLVAAAGVAALVRAAVEEPAGREVEAAGARDAAAPADHPELEVQVRLYLPTPCKPSSSG